MKILSIPQSYGLARPKSGGQNRYSHLVAGLQSIGQRVTILEPAAFHSPGDSEETTVYTFEDWRWFGKSLALLRDINIRYFNCLRSILSKQRIDLLEATHPGGMLAAFIVAGGRMHRFPIVYSAHNVEAEFASEAYARNQDSSWIERLIVPKYVALLERLVCKYVVDHIVVCSTRDREMLIDRYSLEPNRITVIPSGGSFLPVANEQARARAKQRLGIAADRKVILFHGMYSLDANRKSVELVKGIIAPLIANTNPEALFLIAGTDMPKFAKANVVSVGFVESLEEVLLAADIAIAPLLAGAGVKHKILDYLAAGLPVVTTTKGIEGIEARNQEEALVVHDVGPDFVASVVYLLNNKGERERIGLNGSKLARLAYDWNLNSRKLGELYEKLTKTRQTWSTRYEAA